MNLANRKSKTVFHMYENYSVFAFANCLHMGACALSPWILIKLISIWHQLMCGETPGVAVELYGLCTCWLSIFISFFNFEDLHGLCLIHKSAHCIPGDMLFQGLHSMREPSTLWLDSMGSKQRREKTEGVQLLSKFVILGGWLLEKHITVWTGQIQQRIISLHLGKNLKKKNLLACCLYCYREQNHIVKWKVIMD